ERAGRDGAGRVRVVAGSDRSGRRASGHADGHCAVTVVRHSDRGCPGDIRGPHAASSASGCRDRVVGTDRNGVAVGVVDEELRHAASSFLVVGGFVGRENVLGNPALFRTFAPGLPRPRADVSGARALGLVFLLRHLVGAPVAAPEGLFLRHHHRNAVEDHSDPAWRVFTRRHAQPSTAGTPSWYLTNDSGSLTRKPYSASARMATRLCSHKEVSWLPMVTVAWVETS